MCTQKILREAVIWLAANTFPLNEDETILKEISRTKTSDSDPVGFLGVTLDSIIV